MKLAFVFPGQGSQSVGMMAAYAGLSQIRETMQEASEVLGQDLWQLIENGPAETLNLTANTQPAMLAVDIAVYRAWLAAGGRRPDVVAGHSLGEYAALVAAGAIEFKEALPLVRYRAEVMQQAVPEGSGGIAAILGLDDDAVKAVCVEAAQGEVVEAVNFNSPGQVVIAGHRSAVERGMELAKARGAKRALLLPMSVPSHCSLLKDAAQKLAARLAVVTVRKPNVPVLHNADVASHGEAGAIGDALARQLHSPVRWVETVRKFAVDGVTHVVECGPGKVLMGLDKRIATDLQHLTLSDAEAVKQALAALA
ncbi:MAG: ACP S-malonyltransferase [Pseudomonadota bacterium]